MQKIIRVALPVNIDELFDYLPMPELTPQIGCRVLVPFGRRKLVGVVLDITDHSAIAEAKLKAIISYLDKQTLLQAQDVKFINWAKAYYHEPIGQVVAAALPCLLRQDISLTTDMFATYMVAPMAVKVKSAQQLALYKFVSEQIAGSSYFSMLKRGYSRRTITALLAKKILVISDNISTDTTTCLVKDDQIVLNDEQQIAVESIATSRSDEVFLLEGITGSGKTQVYMEAIAATLKLGKQVLVLLPEIGLTPQTLRRFKVKFSVNIAVLHSRLSESVRFATWMEAVTGQARLVIGTRLAIFTPMPDLGMIIIDEEHDLSFKQHSGFRYMARDLAVVKAKMYNIKLVMGTATPSLETYNNAQAGRYTHLSLTKRAAGASLPTISLIDLRNKRVEYGLTAPLIKEIKSHLAADNQVLLFLNRRGYCPVILCHSCGWSAKCEACDSNYSYHKEKQLLFCHSCNSKKTLMSKCGNCNSTELIQVGLGTEKLAEGVEKIFPDTKIIRVDRDAVTANNTLEDLLASAYAGASQVIVGTQMLAKGHHLPKLTLVAILDADGALYSSDFRATERLMQTIVQVAGRAGRGDTPGKVVIQTHMPGNAFLQSVLQNSYNDFINMALNERSQASMPPYTALALLTADANSLGVALNFLKRIRADNIKYLPSGVTMLGPMTAVLSKRSGKYRGQVLIHSLAKNTLQDFLAMLVPKINTVKTPSDLRWFIDVDPLEML